MTNDPEQEFLNALYEQAIDYVDRGWSIFPLSIDGKRPLNEWAEYQTRRTTQDEVDEWFDLGAPTKGGERHKIFNLAIATGSLSGLLVVDCDNEAALDYAVSTKWTSPFAVNTTRGKHYYFAHPGQGRRFQNKAGGIGRDWPMVRGLDFRGDGGYVVAPPSLSFHDDGTIKHSYEFDLPTGIDWDDLPYWQGDHQAVEAFEGREFTFEDISLAGVATSAQSISVEEQVRTKVALLGRKLGVGDGTDAWMIKFCGQLVRKGIVNGDLTKRVDTFYEEFFADSETVEETNRWLRQKMESAIQMDRANYSNDYEIDGTRKKPEALKPTARAALDFFTFDNAASLLSTVRSQTFWSDPVLPVGNIVQVAGYNGHGKSFFLTNLLTSLGFGSDTFGPFANTNGAAPVCYFDFDNPARTLLERVLSQGKAIGNPGSNLKYWSSSVLKDQRDINLNLLSDIGANNLLCMLNTAQPAVVVIDSIRNAFGGMDENGTQDWAKVNKLAKKIRDDFEATVVLVHHRNKPGADGLGREAGSTAQLTDLDTQVMVTQVYEDERTSKGKAGALDAHLEFECIGWNRGIERTMRTPFGYIRSQMEKIKSETGRDLRIRMVSQISFGKVRNETELHQTHYIGYCEYLDTGESHIITTKSRRQYAAILSGVGMPAPDISRELMIPMSVVKEWVT